MTPGRAGDEVLIVGGGIGGLSAALALSRAGARAVVLERADEFGELGAGIQLAPNATRILAGFGLLDRIQSVGVLPNRLVLSSALSGEELTSLPLADFPDRYGAPYVVLHRGDLLSILLDACREDDRIELEAACAVTAVDAGDETVTASCGDGSVRVGKALVGADGLRSTVRRTLSEDEPICSGYVAYRGAIPLAQIARPSDLDDVVAFIGPGMHFVQYPIRRGELYNQVAVFRSRRFADGDEEWGDSEELEEAFAPACEHVREALRSIKRDLRWPMFDRPPLERWTEGRITLLGDAAHPMLQYLAQGACQAIEDAAALGDAARLWIEGGLDVESALGTYEVNRRPRTASIQRNARLWGDFWHLDGIGATARDLYLRERAVDDHRHVRWLYGPGSN